MPFKGATPERLALAERVRAMRDEEGLLYREIQARLGISHTYAQQLYTDPDGSQTRARKDGYAGACIDCGAPTSGSDGPGCAPERCQDCATRFQTESKQWTREAIIDAVHRFAEVHGRPPTADDWRFSNRGDGYPATSTVHSNHNGRTPPFASWADAIEAAGYLRPNSGRRTIEEAGMQARNGYVVLRENADGSWEIVGERAENTQLQALNAALDGHEPEGRWLAVPARYWRPRELKPRTIYDFVEEPPHAATGASR